MKNMNYLDLQLEGETWHPIPCYENYEVSSLVRFKSLKRDFISIKGTPYRRPEHIVKQTVSKKGYLRVKFVKNDKIVCFTSHLLWAELLMPNPDPSVYDQINHINGIKTDNRRDNFEWSNNSLNIKHAFAMGLNTPRRGELNGMSKITECTAIAIKKMIASGARGVDIERAFNINGSMVQDIKNNRTWAHVKIPEVM